jgi:hypothetical protein
VLALALAGQTLAGVPAIGEPDIVAKLGESDIAAITERTRDTCSTVWLVKAFRSQLMNAQFVEAYCAVVPTPEGGVYLRRGTYVGLGRDRTAPWAVRNTGQYAQVSADGRTPDQIPGDRDIRRPFRLKGSFTDAELVSLVLFVRSGPANPQPSAHDPRVQGGWPMNGVWRNADGTIDVGLSQSDFESQRVTVRRTEHGWDVVKIGFVVV